MKHQRPVAPRKTVISRSRSADVVSKRLCHRCHGTGSAPCRICNGNGQVMRGRDVNGHPVFGRCDGCMGAKTSRCRSCGGTRFA